MTDATASGRGTIAFRCDIDDPAVGFAITRLAAAVAEAGFGWSDSGADHPVRQIEARLGPEHNGDQLGDQAYRISTADDGRLWSVQASGRAGLMYGLLRLAECLRMDGPDGIRAEQRSPRLGYRGLKINLPLDARTPGYSDAGDSARLNIATMWSEEFWRDLLDRMATERYNLLSLWNLHPFPSLVRVPEYPAVALDDVMIADRLPAAHTIGVGMTGPPDRRLTVVRRMTVEQKTAFWRQVMQYAADRCIEVIIFTWNVFSYGTEDSPYPITDRMDDPVTVDYLRASVRALLQAYPKLSGIGITAGEHMDRSDGGALRNQQWLRATYGAGIKDVLDQDPDRKIRLIHRSHWADINITSEVFADVPVAAEFSYKYSGAHLHATTRPPYMDEDRFLDQLPPAARLWLTVRDDDYYLMRPGDPGFVRSYLQQLPRPDLLNGWYLGSDGFTLGRDQLSRSNGRPRQLIFDRQWYQYAMFGQLGFDPGLPDEYFRRRLELRYPGVDAAALDRAWRSASLIIRLVNQFHFGGNRFDLDWYPEACLSHPRQRRGFHTVHDFISCAPMPNSGMISIPDAIRGVSDGRRPEEVAEAIDHAADAASGEPTPAAGGTGELADVLADLDSLARLGHYYAAKIRGAIAVCEVLALPGGDAAERARERGIAELTAAAAHWSGYATSIHDRYVPQRLTRLGGMLVDLHRLQAEVDYDITLARSAGFDDYQPGRYAVD
ncbi:MAG: hypothetical protein J2P23_06725 [Microlunatus sp.]|nr:hypothetical protein [Microlunatus sp.]